jgi:hypothetical protein
MPLRLKALYNPRMPNMVQRHLPILTAPQLYALWAAFKVSNNARRPVPLDLSRISSYNKLYSMHIFSQDHDLK